MLSDLKAFDLMLNSIVYPQWFSALVVFFVAAAVGSHLNAIVFRSPLRILAAQDEGLMREYGIPMSACSSLKQWTKFRSESGRRSACTSCNSVIPFYDNIPILSYLLLRGRCRACRETYSPRYLVVELLSIGGALGCLAFLFDYQVSIGFLAMFVLIMVSIVISMVDIDRYFIIDSHSTVYVLSFLLTVFFTDLQSMLDFGAFVEVCLYVALVHVVFNLPLAKLKGVDSAVGEGDLPLLVVGFVLCSMLTTSMDALRALAIYLMGVGVLGIMTAMLLRNRKHDEIPAAPAIILTNIGLIAYLLN